MDDETKAAVEGAETEAAPEPQAGPVITYVGELQDGTDTQAWPDRENVWNECLGKGFAQPTAIKVYEDAVLVRTEDVPFDGVEPRPPLP